MSMDFAPGYCSHCNNTGSVDCYCGGDLCVCENYGEEPCPYCDGGSGFYCDDVEKGFDAGEWNNASVIPCKKGPECNWPACSLACEGRPCRETSPAQDSALS